MKGELISQAGCIPDARMLSGDLPPPLSYTARASKALNGKSIAVRRYPSPQSRVDFLRAVRMLAAVPASQGCPSQLPKLEIHDVWTTFVRYPLETWAKVFGAPESEMHVERQSAYRPVHVWGYHCSDGVVRCIVYLLDRPHGPWILVARVCCFQPLSGTT